jgi:Protein of unknown function (DUF2726)
MELSAETTVAQPGWRLACFRHQSSLPYSKKKILFSAAERSLYEILRCITPDHTIFAKVRLSDVISVSNRAKTGQANYNQIQSKHLNFLICDATLAPIVAIELNDPSPTQTERNCEEFVDAALEAAAVPILRIPIKPSYAINEIRRLIFPHLHGPGPLC